MKENNNSLIKKTKYMMFLYGFLGIFMVAALVITNTAKPTYSATTCANLYTADACTAVAGCSWQYYGSSLSCVGTPTGDNSGSSSSSSTTTTRPSNCLSSSQCSQRAASCEYG